MPSFGTVIFDCDSTLSFIEGVEELSGPRQEEVARLTALAMDGGVPLEEVYGRRLELVRPCRDDVQRLGARYIETLVPGAAEVVAGLRAAGVEVRIVSGGLKDAVTLLAKHLGVAPSHVAAVQLEFAPDGSYLDFDRASPLTRAGGKQQVICAWSPTLPTPVMLVGDGATDLEARGEVDAFVAFTGVVDRPRVRDAADAVVHGPSLLPVLELAGVAAGPSGTPASPHQAARPTAGPPPQRPTKKDS